MRRVVGEEGWCGALLFYEVLVYRLLVPMVGRQQRARLPRTDVHDEEAHARERQVVEVRCLVVAQCLKQLGVVTDRDVFQWHSHGNGSGVKKGLVLPQRLEGVRSGSELGGWLGVW